MDFFHCKDLFSAQIKLELMGKMIEDEWDGG